MGTCTCVRYLKKTHTHCATTPNMTRLFLVIYHPGKVTFYFMCVNHCNPSESETYLQCVFFVVLLHVHICILFMLPAIIKLSSYPQRALQNLSLASCTEVASCPLVVRLHRDARYGDLWECGVPLLAVLQPAGLRAVCPQRQRGCVHLQLPLSVQQLHSDRTEDMDRLVKLQISTFLSSDLSDVISSTGLVYSFKSCLHYDWGWVLLGKHTEPGCCFFNLLLKLLKVEMYTNIMDIKPEHVLNTTLFHSSSLCRSPPGLFQEQLQPSGAWWDIRGVCEENQSSWDVDGVMRGTNTAVLFVWSWSCHGVGWEMMHRRRCEAKQNVALKIRNWVLLVNMLNAAQLCGFTGGAQRLRRRRLKWGKWMWCIYRASAQWLFDLPASSLPLPTTI